MAQEMIDRIKNMPGFDVSDICSTELDSFPHQQQKVVPLPGVGKETSKPKKYGLDFDAINEQKKTKSNQPSQNSVVKFKYNGVCMDYCVNWDDSLLLGEIITAHTAGKLQVSTHMLANRETKCFYIYYGNIKKFQQLKIAYDIATKPDMGLEERFGTDEMGQMLQMISTAMEDDRSLVPMSNSNKRLIKQSVNKSAKTRRTRKDIKPITHG